jgi:hypothetical protein
LVDVSWQLLTPIKLAIVVRRALLDLDDEQIASLAPVRSAPMYDDIREDGCAVLVFNARPQRGDVLVAKIESLGVMLSAFEVAVVLTVNAPVFAPFVDLTLQVHGKTMGKRSFVHVHFQQLAVLVDEANKSLGKRKFHSFFHAFLLTTWLPTSSVRVPDQATGGWPMASRASAAADAASSREAPAERATGKSET